MYSTSSPSYTSPKFNIAPGKKVGTEDEATFLLGLGNFSGANC